MIATHENIPHFILNFARANTYFFVSLWYPRAAFYFTLFVKTVELLFGVLTSVIIYNILLK